MQGTDAAKRKASEMVGAAQEAAEGAKRRAVEAAQAIGKTLGIAGEEGGEGDVAALGDQEGREAMHGGEEDMPQVQ